MKENGVPFHRQIKDSIIAMIKSGELKEGAKIPSTAELCRKYKVSLITVRRAVSDLKSEGILRGEFGKGVYIDKLPEEVPNQDKNTAPDTICGVWSAMLDENILHIQEGMSRYAQEHGLCLELYHCKENGADEAVEILRSLALRKVSGIAVFPSDSESYINEIRKLAKTEIRLVAVDRKIEGETLSFVSSDNFGGAYLATQHLLRQQNGPVHYLGLNDPASAVKERLAGYKKAMLDLGYTEKELESFIHISALFKDEENVLLERWKWRPGYQAAALNVLKRIKQFPVSFFCLNDYIARGLYDAAAELNLQVGKDILTVGFDDLPIASRLSPPLSSVKQDFIAIGHRAAALLNGPALSSKFDMRVPVELIIRQSSLKEELKSNENK